MALPVLAEALTDANADVSGEASAAVDHFLRTRGPRREQLLALLQRASGVAAVRALLDKITRAEEESERSFRVRDADSAMLGSATAAASTAPGPSAPAPRSSLPPVAAVKQPLTDAVWFSVTAPAQVEPGTICLLDVWAHGPSDHHAVIARARDGSPRCAVASIPGCSGL